MNATRGDHHRGRRQVNIADGRDAGSARARAERPYPPDPGNRDAYLPNLAAAVNNLANRLAEAGRRAEGLAAAQEAVTIYEALVSLEPDSFALDLVDARELVPKLSDDDA